MCVSKITNKDNTLIGKGKLIVINEKKMQIKIFFILIGSQFFNPRVGYAQAHYEHRVVV